MSSPSGAATSGGQAACSTRHRVATHLGKTGLEGRAGDRLAQQLAHPRVAAREHRREQGLGARRVVVDMLEQVLDIGRRTLVAPVEAREQVARGLHVQRRGVLDALGLCAEARQHRHLARERGAQRIDGLHPQALRRLLELPAQRVVARECGGRELPGERVVRHLGAWVVARGVQRLEHAPAHLGGGLDGEGDGADLLRPLDRREQRQHALDQQLGLAGARGRLHDERAARVERARALREVGHVIHRRPPPCARRMHPSPRCGRRCAGRSWRR